MFWQALRGRLLARPSSYAGISTIGITVETGGQLAAQSDKRISVVATRNYDGEEIGPLAGRSIMSHVTRVIVMIRLIWQRLICWSLPTDTKGSILIIRLPVTAHRLRIFSTR